jgi:hypothetical protein
MQNGIGDLSSKEAGTAARFNAGKPKVQLLPLRVLSDLLGQKLRRDAARAAQAHQIPAASPQEQAVRCLNWLGAFQARVGADENGSRESLQNAVMALDVPVEACADAFEYGIKKYAAWNWAKGMPWSEMVGSSSRHLLKIVKGEELDAESGCRHDGMAMFGLVCLLVYLTSYPEGDDRPYNLMKASGEAPDANRV